MKKELLKLACTSFLAMMCMSVNAQETSGNCGENATWSYDADETTLTISGTGAMDDYAYGEAPWNAYAEAMKFVEIEAGITSIGSNAFAGFETLTSVTFPSSGFTSIGDYAFSGCTKLKRPNLPSTLTNLGNGAFSSSGVRGINIPAGVTTIGDYAFEDCTSLDGVSIFEGVEEIGEGAFDRCALTSVAIPNSVTTIGDCAFMSNEALKSVFIGSGVVNIGTCAFQGCTALKEVGLATATLPTLGDAVFDAGDGETLLDIDAFYVPSTDLYSSGWAGYAADKFKTTYEGAWNYQDNNTRTDDPTQGTGNWSFNVPTGTLTVTGTGMLNVSPWMGLTAINPEIYTEDYPGFWYKVKSFVVGEGITGIQTMGGGMQINCASVSLPSTLTYVGYSCLEECAFTSIILPEGLETIDDYTFFGSKLTSLTIPSSVTYIGNSAFLENQDLATVTCLGMTPPTFGEYEPAFGDGSYLTAIKVPAASVAAYKEALGWSTYAEFIQMISTTVGDYQWVTFYDGTTNYIADDNTTVYTASLTGTTLSLSEVDDKFIPAGNAVILKSEGVPELTATPAAGTDLTGNDLQGSDTPVVQDDAYAYYALAYIDGKLAFCQVGPDVVIPAGKAYLTVPSAGAPARWFFEYADSDTATKIAGVNKAQNETGAIYTLQGQRVSAPAKSGVYIVGGKKVFIR